MTRAEKHGMICCDRLIGIGSQPGGYFLSWMIDHEPVRAAGLRAAGINYESRTPQVLACNIWLDELLAQGVQVALPEIIDYELRRELLRARKSTGLRRLDYFAKNLLYLPLTTETMHLAAQFWAGLPTATDDALDGDVILAVQAMVLHSLGEDVVIATMNARHLARLAPAEHWDKITA